MKYFIIDILVFILVFNITLFYLDDFKLSSNGYFKVSQILSPFLLALLIGIVLLEIHIFYSQYGGVTFNLLKEGVEIKDSNEISSILFMTGSNDKNSNISIGANVEVGKEAASEISRGISSLGSNVGLAATVGAMASSVSKVVSNSSLPPVQKAGLVVFSGAIGAGIHVGASTVNKINSSSTSSSSNTSSGVSGGSTNTSTVGPSSDTSLKYSIDSADIISDQKFLDENIIDLHVFLKDQVNNIINNKYIY